MLRVLSKKSLAFGANAEHASEKLCRNFLRRRPISSLPQKRALHNFQNSSRSDRTIMLLGWWKCVLWGCLEGGGWCEDTTSSPTFTLILKDAFSCRNTNYQHLICMIAILLPFYLCFVVKFTISFICISSVSTFIISWLIVQSLSRTSLILKSLWFKFVLIP